MDTGVNMDGVSALIRMQFLRVRRTGISETPSQLYYNVSESLWKCHVRYHRRGKVEDSARRFGEVQGGNPSCFAQWGNIEARFSNSMGTGAR